MYKYDDTFYNYIQKGSISSASLIVPKLFDYIENLDSILDIGCGTGAWLKIWAENNIEITGIDGPYVDTKQLLINSDYFIAKDITQPINLEKKFSICQCLEVAEHIDEVYADILIKNLIIHSDVIVFSSAPPGQGGDNHINEKPYSYWQKKFHLKGYLMTDPLRKDIMNNKKIEKWYRYNIFIYVNSNVIEKYPKLKNSLIDEPIDISPISYKFRKKIISFLPNRLATLLAKVKENVFLVLRKLDFY